MNLVLTVLGVAAGLAAVGECGLRFQRFRLAPLRLRLHYAFWLMPAHATQALYSLHQRVERAGVSSFRELFALYAAASGKSVETIEHLFGMKMSWFRLFSSRFAVRYHLRWHIGLVPVPNQRLRTLTIGADSCRASMRESDIKDRSEPLVKRVMLLGGSALFGEGATSDETTVGGRLADYLNSGGDGSCRWEVSNHAFRSATSFQELLVALQSVEFQDADYVVSLSGWNDVDQQFYSGRVNVSALTQSHTDRLQSHPPVVHLMRALGARWFGLAVLRRFMEAYQRGSDDPVQSASA